MLLEGKTAIITGAGSGMGKATAILFANEGANVVVADLNREAAEQTAKEIGNNQVLSVETNVAEGTDVKKLITEAVDRFSYLDILVNCAGVPMAFTPIEEVDDDQWNRIMDVNLKSIYLMTKYAVPHLKERETSAIINIASIAGVRARPGLNAYCASKAGAIMLSRALALELAPYHIRVNAINPGPAETPMLNKFINGDEEQIQRDRDEIFKSSVPLGQLIQAQDIAEAALYLASNKAKIVTGEVLNVDGGRGI